MGYDAVSCARDGGGITLFFLLSKERKMITYPWIGRTCFVQILMCKNTQGAFYYSFTEFMEKP